MTDEFEIGKPPVYHCEKHGNVEGIAMTFMATGPSAERILGSDPAERKYCFYCYLELIERECCKVEKKL